MSPLAGALISACIRPRGILNKLVFVCESPRALASRLFEPRRGSKKYRTRGRMPAEFDSPRMGAK